jgi:hypothetical protein
LTDLARIHHIVGVRFSIKNKAGWHTRAYGDESAREAWFAMRARLFLSTLHASLLSQTCPPHKVFLMMDEADRGFYDRYLDLKESFYHPLFNVADAGHDEMAHVLSQSRLNNLAISRIDSDDLIHSGYLAAINQTICDGLSLGKKFDYVVAARGYRTDGHRIKSAFFNYSPFITVFADVFQGQTPYGFRHGDVLKHATLVCGQAHWMQFIHGGNLANQMKPVTWWDRLMGRSLSPLAFDKKVQALNASRRRHKFYSVESPVNQQWPAGFAPYLPLQNFA